MSKLGDLKRNGGIPSTALGDGSPPAPSTTALGRLTLARGAPADLPILGPAWVQLISHNQENQVEAGVIEAMTSHKIPLGDIWVWTVALERKVRTLAIAVRESADPTQPFGTLEEWQALDDRIIFACDLVYGAIRDRLDPLASSFTVADHRAAEILDGFKKKDRMHLLSFGIDELVSWLLSGAVQPSISPTPSSGTTA